MGVVKLSDFERNRAPRVESAKILGECRDLALHRLLVSFTSMLDRLSTMLFDHADKALERDDTNRYLAARALVQKERANIVSDFERILRQRVEQGISGRDIKAKKDFASLDSKTLSLVGEDEIEKSVVTANLSRQLENTCRDELSALNQRLGFLLGKGEMESDENPLSPSEIIDAFKSAVDRLETEADIKLAVLRELNQNVLGDINSIYADLNRHLVNLHVLPLLRPSLRRPKSDAGRESIATPTAADQDPGMGGSPDSRADMLGQPDVFSTLKMLLARAQRRTCAARLTGADSSGGAGLAHLDSKKSSIANLNSALATALDRDSSGPSPSADDASEGSTIADHLLLDALTRLQRGETGFSIGGGALIDFPLDFSGATNMLRTIAKSNLVPQMGQMDAMTMELVAMIFDYVFQDYGIPDAIKALLGRLQIPVLKAAMLDKAFFSKKSHPARVLVNKLAEAGMGWSPEQGSEDPLYKKIASIVQRVQSEFVDQVELFAIELADLEDFLSDEDKQAEVRIEASADEIHQRDQAEIARIVAAAEIDKHVAQAIAQHHVPIPGYLVSFLRERWVIPMYGVWLRDGEESALWANMLTTLDDLLWSVQPKRFPDDRRKLVKLLPSLLQRLYAGLQEVAWSDDERQAFLNCLVDSHAAAVKASLSQTAAVLQGDAAIASQEIGVAPQDTKAPERVSEELLSPDGGEGGGAAGNIAELPTSSAPSYPDESVEAGTLSRGVWVEFTQEDGTLLSSRLAWISPLRGNYLFTNRQGRNAFALSREELSERFQRNRARLVEAEPLLDRALSKLMASLTDSNEELTPTPA